MKCYIEEVDVYVRDRARCTLSEKQGIGCIAPMLRAGHLQMCTHAHTRCSCGLTMRMMLAFS